ncbi:Hypothetical protein, putative [Bodo saltans]|uniref:Uncharacterized protein n=1 Tax=Bodo saltans TaxID=75058 RepID=A0A0S4JN01_BODSA|nr:Hypothetical protein, putative [Bodo saltans]|eukprot:CUG90774.1 Hypothetical protein, putative [Bodo saltans]
MGGGPSMLRPPRNPVPESKIRICVAGIKISPETGRSRAIAGLIAKFHPDKYETWFFFNEADAFDALCKELFDPIPFPPHLKGHTTSPFVWLEEGKENVMTPIGGNDHFTKWTLNNPDFANTKEIKELANSWIGLSHLFHNNSADAPQSTADITSKSHTSKSQ